MCICACEKIDLWTDRSIHQTDTIWDPFRSFVCISYRQRMNPPIAMLRLLPRQPSPQPAWSWHVHVCKSPHICGAWILAGAGQTSVDMLLELLVVMWLGGVATALLLNPDARTPGKILVMRVFFCFLPKIASRGIEATMFGKL